MCCPGGNNMNTSFAWGPISLWYVSRTFDEVNEILMQIQELMKESTCISHIKKRFSDAFPKRKMYLGVKVPSDSVFQKFPSRRSFLHCLESETGVASPYRSASSGRTGTGKQCTKGAIYLRAGNIIKIMNGYYWDRESSIKIKESDDRHSKGKVLHGHSQFLKAWGISMFKLKLRQSRIQFICL